MKRVIFLLFFLGLVSCSNQENLDNQIEESNNSWNIDEKNISSIHDESLGWFCVCASCLWISQKDEFIL